MLYGKVMLFENANISGRSSSIEEDTDTEKISVSAIFPVEDKNAAGTLSAIEEDDETSVQSSFKTIEINTEYEEA